MAGKSRQYGKVLDGKFCDNKEIYVYKGKYAILEGNLVKLDGNSDLLAGK